MKLYYNYSHFGNFWSVYMHEEIYDVFECDLPSGVSHFVSDAGFDCVEYGDGYSDGLQECLCDRNGIPVLKLKFPTEEYGKFKTRYFAFKHVRRCNHGSY